MLTRILRNIVSPVLVSLVCAIPVGALAQAYPSKPIRLLVPYPPGGSTDALARQLSVRLSTQLKQTVLVDNRPGGSSAIAVQALAAAPADGYTILIVDPTAFSINPSLYKKLPYDASDITPVSLLARFSFSLLVPASSPANSVRDFVAYSKTKRDQLSFGSSGAGTLTHLGMEILKSSSGASMVHIPYRGGAPAMTDLLSGQIEALMTDLAFGLEYVKSGRVKALAITSGKRSAALPNVPTFVEAGFPNFEVGGWFGIVVRKNTPPEIVAALNAALREAVAQPEVSAWITSVTLEPATSTPEEFARVIREDAGKWGKVIKDLGISAD